MRYSYIRRPADSDYLRLEVGLRNRHFDSVNSLDQTDSQHSIRGNNGNTENTLPLMMRVDRDELVSNFGIILKNR
jgi:hypothetical protein